MSCPVVLHMLTLLERLLFVRACTAFDLREATALNAGIAVLPLPPEQPAYNTQILSRHRYQEPCAIPKTPPGKVMVLEALLKAIKLSAPTDKVSLNGA